MNLQGTLLKALVLLMLTGAVLYGIVQAFKVYGRAEVQQVRAAQSEAILKSTQEVIVRNAIADAAGTHRRAVLVAPVHAAIQKTRESLVEIPELPTQADYDGAVGAEYLRLLNNAIRASNHSVRTAQGLP